MTDSADLKVTPCPYCRAHPASTEPGIKPFCSPRCKQLDFGNWAAERYRVPGPPASLTEDSDEESEP